MKLMKLMMDKYKTFYGILLIIIILLNFVSVCATNEGSKKSKNTDGDVDSGSGTSTSKSGGKGTPRPTDSKSATPSEGGPSKGGPSKGGPSEGGPSEGGPSASPPEGGPPPSKSGTPATPSGGEPSAPPPEGGTTPPSKSPEGKVPPAGGTPSANPPANPPANTPEGGNATVLAYVAFSKTPSTTTEGRPQVGGLISLFQPPNGNTRVTGQIGVLFNRINGNYKFTIKDDGGSIFYDCTGHVNPLFIDQVSFFSFTWDAIRLTGPNTAIGKHFVIEESGGTLANGIITREFEL